MAGELNELKYKHGLIDAATYSAVSHSLTAAEAVLGEMDRAAGLPADKRAATLAMIRKQIRIANGAALCGWTNSSGRCRIGSTSAAPLFAG
ncbi:MAG: hypothetical protein IH941_10990 [Acidobacteria bacterium]|nr:hypothetical protein [Acidobacteriota bacterium]